MVQEAKVRMRFINYVSIINYAIVLRLVKLSSPYVNTVIIAGAVVFYVMVILFGVDENVTSSTTVDGLCNVRIWLVAIGFSLLYGTIFAKTWRVYYIFNYTKPNSKFVSILICRYRYVAMYVTILNHFHSGS